MQITHHTPPEADGKRLFYRTQYDVRAGRVGGHYRGPLFIPPRGNADKGLFRLADPDNVYAQFRLYRYSHKRHADTRGGDYSGAIEKNELMERLFWDTPSVNKVRVGRLLRLILPYEPNFQKNPAKSTGGRNVMMWRWSHSLEIVYGLEHLMLQWLPKFVNADDGQCHTAEDFAEELEIIRDQTLQEDHDIVSAIVAKHF